MTPRTVRPRVGDGFRHSRPFGVWTIPSARQWNRSRLLVAIVALVLLTQNVILTEQLPFLKSKPKTKTLADEETVTSDEVYCESFRGNLDPETSQNKKCWSICGQHCDDKTIALGRMKEWHLEPTGSTKHCKVGSRYALRHECQVTEGPSSQALIDAKEAALKEPEAPEPESAPVAPAYPQWGYQHGAYGGQQPYGYPASAQAPQQAYSAAQQQQYGYTQTGQQPQPEEGHDVWFWVIVAAVSLVIVAFGIGGIYFCMKFVTFEDERYSGRSRRGRYA